MSSTNTLAVLNRLYAIHSRSLPSYLNYAPPWGLSHATETRQALEQIAASQAELTDQIGSLILQADGDIIGGEYPMVFTGWHDLAYEFIVGKVIEYQNRDIALIEQCVAELESAPHARALAEECLGAAKGHLEQLQELTKEAV